MRAHVHDVGPRCTAAPGHRHSPDRGPTRRQKDVLPAAVGPNVRPEPGAQIGGGARRDGDHAVRAIGKRVLPGRPGEREAEVKVDDASMVKNRQIFETMSAVDIEGLPRKDVLDELAKYDIEYGPPMHTP